LSRLDVVGSNEPIIRTFDLRGCLPANRPDRSDVARVVRRCVAAAGIVGGLAGHSLRSGFITNAAK
jgi:hypothetical protein